MEMDDGMFADLRVVVIDDSRNFQNLLRTMLRHIGFRRIDTFSDPADALTHVSTNPVDLVFVDYLMPHQNGAQWTYIARRLADIANPEMSIVLVTAHPDHAVIDAALCAGVDDVLAKPLAPEILLRHIRRVLARPRRYIRTIGGYYGPEIAPALRRLREMAPANSATPILRRRAPVAPVKPPAPRRTVPGLVVPVRPPVPDLVVAAVRPQAPDTSDTMYLD